MDFIVEVLAFIFIECALAFPGAFLLSHLVKPKLTVRQIIDRKHDKALLAGTAFWIILLIIGLAAKWWFDAQ